MESRVNQAKLHAWKKSIPAHLLRVFDVDHTHKKYTDETTRRMLEFEPILNEVKDSSEYEIIKERLYYPIKISYRKAKHMAQIYIQPLLAQVREKHYICVLKGPEYNDNDVNDYFKELSDKITVLHEEVESEIRQWIMDQTQTVRTAIEEVKIEQYQQLKFELQSRIVHGFVYDWLTLPNEDILRNIMYRILEEADLHTVQLDVCMDRNIVVVPANRAEISLDQLDYVKQMLEDIIWGTIELYIALTIEKKSRLFGKTITDNEILAANPEIVFIQNNQPVTYIDSGSAETFETWMDKA